jgi:nitrate reductase gamma subunit
MFEMVSKIVKRLNSINSFSGNIIKIGCYISFVMCLMGLVVINYNNIIGESIRLNTIGSSLIYTAILLFTQTVIGGLLIDLFGNAISGNF